MIDIEDFKRIEEYTENSPLDLKSSSSFLVSVKNIILRMINKKSQPKKMIFKF